MYTDGSFVSHGGPSEVSAGCSLGGRSLDPELTFSDSLYLPSAVLTNTLPNGELEISPFPTNKILMRLSTSSHTNTK